MANSCHYVRQSQNSKIFHNLSSAFGNVMTIFCIIISTLNDIHSFDKTVYAGNRLIYIVLLVYVDFITGTHKF